MLVVEYELTPFYILSTVGYKSVAISGVYDYNVLEVIFVGRIYYGKIEFRL